MGFWDAADALPDAQASKHWGQKSYKTKKINN